MAFIVDIPRQDEGWDEVAQFDTRQDAIDYCILHFGADAEGNINLISEVRDEFRE